MEATNEAIKGQVARKSNLQLLDNGHHAALADLKIQASSQASSGTDQVYSSSIPSRAKSLSSEPNNNPQTSPKAGCSSQRDSPKPCSSSSQHQKSPEGDLSKFNSIKS